MGTIADKLEYLNDTKTEIKEAIVNKGQSIADTDTFRSYADKINKIVVSKTQSKTQTISSNTTTTIKPDAGYTGLSQVSVVTNVPTGWISPGYQLSATRNSSSGTSDKTGTFNIPAGKKVAILVACQTTLGSQWFGVESANNCTAVVLKSGSSTTNGGSGNETWENASYLFKGVCTIGGMSTGMALIAYKITVTDTSKAASIVAKLGGGEQRQGFVLGFY